MQDVYGKIVSIMSAENKQSVKRNPIALGNSLRKRKQGPHKPSKGAGSFKRRQKHKNDYLES